MKFFSREKNAKPRFETVVDQELPMLFRIAVRMTLNEAEAEDLVGQTLYLATKAWDNFDGAHPRGWLIAILRNEFLAMKRKNSARPTVALDDAAEPSTEGYWQEIDWKLIGTQIISLLDRLPEDFRLPIALCDVEQLTRDEAALSLAIPIGTLNSRLNRGRNMLRTLALQTLGDPTLQPQ